MSVTEQLSMNKVILGVKGWTENEVALIELYSQRKSFGGINERALAMLLIRDGGVDYGMHWCPNRVKESKECDK
jgi:hypothetical protein